MAKHNKNKKRNIKKRVKKNVQKIKEITTEDLILNPALMYSPQFKALPLDKQFQLLGQVKQLRALMGNKGGTVISGSSGADPSLYTKLNDLNNKAMRQANENEQLRIYLQSSNESYKKELELNKQLKQKMKRQKDDLDQEYKVADLEFQNQQFDKKAQDTRQQQLTKQLNQKRKEANTKEIKEKKIENAKLNAELQQYEQVTSPKHKSKKSNSPSLRPKPTYTPLTLSSPTLSISAPETPEVSYQKEGEDRILAEKMKQQKDSQQQEEAVYQQQFNAFTKNGDEDQAEKTEKQFLSKQNSSVSPSGDETQQTQTTPTKKNDINDGVDDINDDNENEEDLNTTEPIDSTEPTQLELNAITVENQLNRDIQTKKEKIQTYEEIEKQKQENKQKIDLTIAQNSDIVPDSPTTKLYLEQEKAKLIEELKSFIQLHSNPNIDYLNRITQQIQNAKTFSRLKEIREAIALDKAYQESQMKQEQYYQEKQAELNSKRQENQNEYERNKQLSMPITPDNTTSRILMEDKKKEAFKALDELMKLPDNPNPEYRRIIAKEIRYSPTNTRLVSLINKINMDKANIEDAVNQHKQLLKKQRELIAKLDDQNKPSNRFHYPPEMWKVKIYQAQTFKEISEIADLMRIFRILTYGPYNLRGERSWKYKTLHYNDEEYIKKADTFFKTNYKPQKKVIFFNGEQIKDLEPEIQTLSPSVDHTMIDFKYFPPLKQKRKWYKLWLSS